MVMLYSSPFSSGNPATLVKTDKMPANTDALHTYSHWTSVNAAETPMVATAVWAMVFTARIPAA